MLSRLEDLSLAHNKVEEVPVFLTALERLKLLDVSHNNIKELPRGLGHCPVLAELVLEGNSISSPPPLILKMGTSSVMMYLVQLCEAQSSGEIKLQGLELPQIPQELSEFTQTTSVDISRNHLTGLRPLNVLTTLTYLNAAQNALLEVEADLKNLTNLEHLDLSCNRIASLVSVVRSMTRLSRLALDDNPLQHLPDGLWSLTNLTNLTVKGCDIKFPPQDVVAKGVKSLLSFQRMTERGRYTRRLDLSGVGFHDLVVPEDLWEALTVLNLDRNYVSKLPHRVTDCSQLVELRCAHNQLVRLPFEIGNLAQLGLLDIRNNLLQALPDSIGLLTALTRIRASGNRLLAVPDTLSDMLMLTELDLKNNALTQVPQSLCMVKGLVHLTLDNNNISQLPLGIGRLIALQTLTFSSNSLVRLPLNVRNLTTLTKFDARDNPGMDLPPVKVVEQGIVAIQAFLTVVHSTIKAPTLDISGFHLPHVPHFVQAIGGLRELCLNNNSIKDLSPCIHLLSSLTALRCKENPLDLIPVEIGGTTTLETLELDQGVWEAAAAALYLSSTRHVRGYLRRVLDAGRTGQFSVKGLGVSRLPKDYGGLDIWALMPGLAYLDAAQNSLTQVNILAHCLSLEKLDLTGNQITALPDTLSVLVRLTGVALSTNRLDCFPSCIQFWTNLKELRIAANRIEQIPVALLAPLQALASLDCKSNQIREVKGPIWLMSKLKLIEVEGNPITSPPLAFVRKGRAAVMGYFRSVDNAGRTRKLALADCELTSIPTEVMAIHSLASLSIDGNQVEHLPGALAPLKSLTFFSARRNLLAEIPASISSLQLLKTLDVSYNKLTDVPIAALQALPALTALHLAGNQLLTPPFELFQHKLIETITLNDNPSLLSPPPLLTADETQGDELVEFLREEARAIKTGRLVLTGVQAVAFPIEILRVHHVVEVNLAKNRIESISTDIAALTSMTRLTVALPYHQTV